jgi:tetratricopeptide (TPR) repeat protein
LLAAGLFTLCMQTASFAAMPTEKDKLQRAHQLVNDYYGDRGNLDEAADLVKSVLKGNPRSAAAYVEAARITIKGGHIVSDEFRPGTKDLYRRLIDRALELEPNNSSALSLKAESYLLSGNTSDAQATIERGLKANPEDPWLKLNLATYYRRKEDPSKAMDIYSEMGKDSRCDSDPDYRRACVRALMELIGLFQSFPENMDVVRPLIKDVERLRHPQDAWTLGGIALAFIYMDHWDDSIDYSRRALKVMNYGVGRLYLAVSLYTKASLLREQGISDVSLLREADSLGVPEEQVLDFFSRIPPPSQDRVALVTRLFEQRVKATSHRDGKPGGVVAR